MANLYPTPITLKSASSVNHSCSPNCVVVFNGKRIMIKKLRNLKEGEEPLISYCEMLSKRSDRQKYLKSNYYFKCKCKRCSQNNGIVIFTYFVKFLLNLKNNLLKTPTKTRMMKF